MSKSVKQAENKPSRKGKTNNPNGRPKTGQAIAEVVRNFLEADDDETKEIRLLRLTRHAYAQALTERKEAVRWADFLADRAYGRAISAIELSGPDGGPVSIKNMADTVLDEEIEKAEKALKALKDNGNRKVNSK